MNELLWWGYLHTEGTLQVKRYFDSRDLEEAKESDFVVAVHGPWPAKNREEAITKLKEDLHGKNNT